MSWNYFSDYDQGKKMQSDEVKAVRQYVEKETEKLYRVFHPENTAFHNPQRDNFPVMLTLFQEAYDPRTPSIYASNGIPVSNSIPCLTFDSSSQFSDGLLKQNEKPFN
jgi:hypothetical protein